MSDKTNKIIYNVTTGLLTIVCLFSAGNYIFNNEMFSQKFLEFGYPTYIIYPLAVANLMGLIAIWSNKSKTLSEWAYAAFFFDFILAIAAHLSINDGGFPFPLFALILLLSSYLSGRRMFGRKSDSKQVIDKDIISVVKI